MLLIILDASSRHRAETQAEETREEEATNLVERERILFDESNQLFNRLESDISYMGGRVSSFFGILLGLISLQVALIALLLNNGGRFSIYSHSLLVLFSATTAVTVIMSVYLLRPRGYKDIEVFREDRFKRLSTCSQEELLSDFLYHTREAYEYNYEIYNRNAECLDVLYVLFLAGNILYVLLVLSMWMR